MSYYGISHGGTGITCAGSPITVSAYDSAGAAATPVAGTQVTLAAVSASGGAATNTWVGGNTYTFGGTETSFTRYLQQLTLATLNINLTDGINAESPTLDPAISFVDTGLFFYGSSSAINPPPIGNQVAGTLDSAPVLKALRADAPTGACVARTTGTGAVRLAYECLNPTTCISGQAFSVNGTNIQSNPLASGANPTYSSVNLTFDSAGTASIPLKYTDVGQVKLFAQLALAASGNDPATTISGTSNNFVVKPHTLAVTSVQTLGGVNNPGGTNAPGLAAGFVPAGTVFHVKVQSQNSAGAPTPNFGNEISSENNILLRNLALVYPSGGTATLLPPNTANSFSTTTPVGTFMSNTIVWDQVGSFTVVPRLADDVYLGAGDIFTPTTSPTIGRFYPDHYKVTSPQAINGCSNFTYMSQPNISLGYMLRAESVANTLLTNYGGNYASGSAMALPGYVAENGNDGFALSSRVSVPSAGTWSGGLLTLSTAAASFNRQPISTLAPDGPFEVLQLGMVITDPFDSRNFSGKNMNATTAGACTTDITCTAVTLGSTLNMRYGRLRLDDAFGPESVKLPVNFLTEYWIGNRFIANTDDSCTIIPRAAISYPAGTLASDANRTVALTGGSTQGTYTNLNATGVNFISGNAGQSFTAPVTGTGTFIVGIDLTNLSWLRSDWNLDGIYSDTLLKANFGFGAFRGNDRLIYWRERFQ